MDTLHDTSWDIVIAGTGLPQSLLALALSRSGSRILHVDQNDYYGGDEAALSLSEARSWAEKHASSDCSASTAFSHASIAVTQGQGQGQEASQARLSAPRAYSLALAPQILYARSTLLSALVSSQAHNQLEFQAVGSWFVLDGTATSKPSQLKKVPGGREDVFNDDTLDLRAKRALMKFLRTVTNQDQGMETEPDDKSERFTAFLQHKFNLPPASHDPILALTLSTQPPASTTAEYALPRIARHLTSIGVFGAGFGALLPKWGGLSEIGQVACRASAVGGAVYVLGQGVTDVQHNDEFDLSITLSNGEKVTTKWICGSLTQLPGATSTETGPSKSLSVSKSISIVSSPLSTLFPPTSEGGVTPAGAVVLVPGDNENENPVHILAHSGEAGECPANQCILYASVNDDRNESGFARLESAVDRLLKSLNLEPNATILWRLQYRQQHVASDLRAQRTGPVITLPSLSPALSLEDSILDSVKVAWQQVTGKKGEDFMKFESRADMVNEDE